MRFLLKLWRLSLYVPFLGNLVAWMFPRDIQIKLAYDQNRSALVYTESDVSTGIVLFESISVMESATHFTEEMAAMFGEKSSDGASSLDWFPHGGSRYGGL